MIRCLRLSLPFLLVFVTVGCAYRWGSPDRSLPGGYRQVTIPVFRNLTQEVGIEVSFTNALIREFERSRTGRVTSPSQAEVQVDGQISSVQYLPGGKNINGAMPTGSGLASEYRIVITSHVKLLRVADRSVLWEGEFSREQTYVAPQVIQAGLNTVNPLYNLSARRQNIEVMAGDMMSEAHDRMTENF